MDETEDVTSTPSDSSTWENIYIVPIVAGVFLLFALGLGLALGHSSSPKPLGKTSGPQMLKKGLLPQGQRFYADYPRPQVSPQRLSNAFAPNPSHWNQYRQRAYDLYPYY